jgi:hypothetical protein
VWAKIGQHSMFLATGSQLDTYKSLAPIRKGETGELYRARHLTRGLSALGCGGDHDYRRSHEFANEGRPIT